MSFRATPGGILAATEAMQDSQRQTYTKAQTAYLVALAYTTGKLHGLHEWMCDRLGDWVPTETPEQIRARMIERRMAEYGPDSGYPGGPVDWETGRWDL